MDHHQQARGVWTCFKHREQVKLKPHQGHAHLSLSTPIQGLYFQRNKSDGWGCPQHGVAFADRLVMAECGTSCDLELSILSIEQYSEQAGIPSAPALHHLTVIQNAFWAQNIAFEQIIVPKKKKKEKLFSTFFHGGWMTTSNRMWCLANMFVKVLHWIAVTKIGIGIW